MISNKPETQQGVLSPCSPLDLRPSLDLTCRKWALKTLLIPKTTPPAEIPAKALEVLEQKKWLCQKDFQRAVRLLITGSESQWSPDDLTFFQGLIEKRVARELRVFQRIFFSLPPEKRKERSGNLAVLCQPYPRLAARLAFLNRGLEITPNLQQFTNPYFRHLAKCSLIMFQTWPTQKSQIYNKYFLRFHKNPLYWKSIAVVFKTRYPQYASLGGHWFQELLHDDSRQNEVEQAFSRLSGEKQLEAIYASQAPISENIEKAKNNAYKEFAFAFLFLWFIVISSLQYMGSSSQKSNNNRFFLKNSEDIKELLRKAQPKQHQGENRPAQSGTHKTREPPLLSQPLPGNQVDREFTPENQIDQTIRTAPLN